MEKREFSKELKYQGWEEMSLLLDKEMPVKKRKKVLILFFTIFILAAISLFLYQKFEDNNHKNVQPLSSQKRTGKNGKNDIPKQSMYLSNKKEKLDKTTKNTSKIESNNNAFKRQPHKQKLNKTNNDFAYSNSQEILKDTHTFDNKISLINKTSQFRNLSEDRETKPIVKLDAKSLSLFSKYLPLLCVNEPVFIKNNQRIDLFNPFAGVKAYVFSTEEFNPKFGFEIGNRFSYSRHFTELSLSFVQSQIIVPQILLYDGKISDVENSGYEKAEPFDTLELSEKPYLKFGVFGINLNQGYRFSRRFNAGLGFGLAYTMPLKKLLYSIDKDSGNLNSNSSNNYNYKNKVFAFDKFSLSANIDLSYRLSKLFTINLGYVFYFNSGYKLQNEKNVGYRTKVLSKSKFSRLNIGIMMWL